MVRMRFIPGYGFLSENAEFAAACEQAGIKFIGPSAQSIRMLGSKTQARKLAIAAGAPVVPGTEQSVSDPVRAREIANNIGYPVLLKAAAGGGGKGMRRVDREADLEAALRDASSEAERHFRNGDVYIEKLVEDPRHIEIQVLGDEFGHMIHLGERECSLQRRHQKVMEESPSPLIAQHPEMRERMGEAALRVACAAGYYNAGTAEFLVDKHLNFYFLEMNTRLQVEHPITELVTGQDLVHHQLRIASGERLALKQDQVKMRGAAIECRIYAEDPDNNFFPSPGLIRHIDRPIGPGIRLDSGVYPGWTVPLDYDPLLAKASVWGASREVAISRMLRALEEYYVAGIKTNITFFRQILEDKEFRAGHLHTGFIDEFFARKTAPDHDEEARAVATLVAAIHQGAQKPAAGMQSNGPIASRWMQGRERLKR